MNGAALIVAFILASILHPFVLLITGRMFMKEHAGLKKYFKITGVFAIVTLVAVIVLVWLSATDMSNYIRNRAMIGTVIGWIGIMKANATYMLEKEEVEEWPLIIHYGLLIYAAYYFLSGVVGEEPSPGMDDSYLQMLLPLRAAV